jgi:hypothetical protein
MTRSPSGTTTPSASPGPGGQQSGSAGRRRGHLRVLRAPGDGELCHRATEFIGDGANALGSGDLLRVGETRGQPAVPGQRATAVGRNAVAVLAGEQARRQRAPDGGAETDVLVEAGVFLFDPVAPEQVVLRLVHEWLVEVVLVGNGIRGHDLGG